MKLERKTFADIDKVVRTMAKKKQKTRELIEEFMDSDMVVAEVVDHNYKKCDVLCADHKQCDQGYAGECGRCQTKGTSVFDQVHHLMAL